VKIWALADLHLSFGVPNKTMDIFSDKWVNHPEKIKVHWQNLIGDEDLVLIPGDISWGMHPEEAQKDLEWIGVLPGTKVMLRGNHDYWWTSLSKVEKILPPSVHLIQNNCFRWKDAVICGARLWDTTEFSFQSYIECQENPAIKKLTETDIHTDDNKIFERELSRLELSLKSLPRDAAIRIAMTHYPPIGPEMLPSRASVLLEKYGITTCVFGHLHNVKSGTLPFGTKNGVRYALVAADYLNFTPLLVK